MIKKEMCQVQKKCAGLSIPSIKCDQKFFIANPNDKIFIVEEIRNH
jgi:hypothetical protein